MKLITRLYLEKFFNLFRKYKHFRVHTEKAEQDCIARMANQIREAEDKKVLEELKSIAETAAKAGMRDPNDYMVIRLMNK